MSIWSAASRFSSGKTGEYVLRVTAIWLWSTSSQRGAAFEGHKKRQSLAPQVPPAGEELDAF